MKKVKLKVSVPANLNVKELFSEIQNFAKANDVEIHKAKEVKSSGMSETDIIISLLISITANRLDPYIIKLSNHLKGIFASNISINSDNENDEEE